METQQQTGTIFALICAGQDVAKGCDIANLSEEIQEQVQAMATDIHQCPTTALSVNHTPVTVIAGFHVQRGRGYRRDGHGRADFSGSKNFLHPQHNRIKPAIVGHPQLHTGILTDLDHLIAFRRGHGHRFFHQNMFTGLGRCLCLRPVQMYRRGNVDGIDIRVRDKFGLVGEGFCHLKFPAKLGQLAFIAPTGRHKLTVRCFLNGGCDTFPGNIATTQ